MAKMTGRRIAVTAVLCAGVMMMGGCSMLNREKEWAPQKSSAISVGSDGGITEYVKDTLDESYYSASELQSMIESEISDYNSKNGENSVSMKDFQVNGKDVQLTMEYEKAEDYAQFNHTEFYYGSMINAQLAGYLFDVSYKEVKNGVAGSAAVSGTEVLKNMASEVMVVTAPVEVHVPGNVLYTSDNAQILAADDVYASGKSDDGSEEKSFDEKAADKRVYIIFDMEE
ncbi:MAG: hypothetical protein PUE72_09785 [Lachnospiraceae bacterium]|nr:hypothetical protein [Lachnospiraceae bacterium]